MIHHGFCRLSSLCSLLGQLLSKKFVLFSTKLDLRKKKHFNAQKFSKTHLQASRISKISRGETPGTPLEGEGREEKGKGRREREGDVKVRREGE